ncbi:DUF2905 domain-containing protein [Salipaludibacillus agaradhaerens]|uniref:DUF2905 domain-containing protein n=1 Tax=Salipaludibacillus agaradhaerens TaxID=76935 RepID=UPI0009964401|nr:DUF2905 domain-containing protein [Salipaludibacillus agaradhaerens]MCR6106185.1 DUF2905 domain-containing protein [Salipaludibacillus agaradhaerens]MCR6118218.1 DUF2905 domain-containing protein [Salipaludibacillus agaradhaerens]
MNQFPKLLILIGLVLIVAGLIWQVGGRFISLGKLPGDIVIRRENATFYFPIMTSIIISIVISIVLYLFGRFR